MDNNKYPLSISIYSGEQGLLIIPFVRHIAGFSVQSEWYKIIKDTNDYSNTGKGLFESIEVIKDSPLLSNSPETWKKGSKYKGWNSFCKNNNLVKILVFENGEYEIYSTERNIVDKKAIYNGCIKKVKLPRVATAEEIGKAVIDVSKAAEEFYKKE